MKVEDESPAGAEVTAILGGRFVRLDYTWAYQSTTLGPTSVPGEVRVETKVFIREPMGVVGSLGMPVIIFIAVGRSLGSGRLSAGSANPAPFNVSILAALIIAVGAVLSLVTIISIYREAGSSSASGQHRCRRDDPGCPCVRQARLHDRSLGLLVLAGRQFLPAAMDVHVPSFTAALLLSTLSILSIGFVIASIVPTARFAQPIGAALLYPMIAVSGLFFPIAQLPPLLQAVANALPTTHAVALMQGIWDGSGWAAHWGNVAALMLVFAVCTGLSTKFFRWE